MPEPTTDDALEIAIQWQNDTKASGDATIVAASIIWLSYVMNAAIKDLAAEIPAHLDVNVNEL